MERTTSELPQLLSAREVSAATGLPLQTVWKLGRRRILPVIRIGPSMWFSARAVAEWLEKGGTLEDTEPGR